MKVVPSKQVELQQVEMDGASGCHVRWLISRDDGAPNFAMRQFEVQPGGYTPRHSHPYEHEIFVIEGQGEVIDGDSPRPIGAGDVVLVAADDVHQFKNVGDSTLKFLCLIPNEADNRPLQQQSECNSVASRG